MELLAGTGLRGFGQTDNHWLVAREPGAAAALARTGLAGLPVKLDPDMPAYLVYQEPQLTAKPLAFPVLFEDGGWRLGQFSDQAADRLARFGFELVRLPDEPFPIRVPSAGGLPMPAKQDTFIERVIARVSADSIHRHIKALTDVRTRYSPAESCRAAEQHLCDYFAGLGLDSAKLDTYGNGWRNVVGEKVGTIHPERIIIVCGHMDAISEDPENFAQGAEDNGSGTAMAIEAARVLAQEDLEMTVRFVGFTGEEQGLFGSQFHAQRARTRGEQIVAVTNYDMVAWPGGRWGVRLVGLARAQRLCRLQARMAALYTGLGTEISQRSFPSDSRSFDDAGYVATSGYEYGTQGYVWYHTTGDTLGNIDMDLAADVARMAIATIATLAVAPAPPEGFDLRDAGSGTSLFASWQANTEPDLAGYRLLWGRDSVNYTDSVDLGRVTAHRVDGLGPDTRYYAAVLAVDSAGHESGLSCERSAVPTVLPLPPVGASALPLWHGMALAWRRNQELDIAGYNLYRTTVSGSGYAKLNPALLADTACRDSGLLSDTMYYYVASAVDTSGNEGGYSSEVRGKPVTLDHGILLVDETRDGSGQPGSPSDAQQDDFWHAILRGSACTDWDVAAGGLPLAGDVGPYSTVAWHADEYQQPLLAGAVAGLANNLSYGGRLWLSGWKPVFGLVGGSARYPYEFAAGQFPYDYLHLARAEQSTLVDFAGAAGAGGYPDVGLDSTKILPAMHGKLPYVDALLPRDAEPVLGFQSASGDTFDGKPVGTRWLGGPGRAVALGFPLYYANEAQARLLALKVMEELGEPIGIAEGRGPEVPGREPEVWPNPAREFAMVWTHGFGDAGRPAAVRVYDVAGQSVLSQSSIDNLQSSLVLDLRGLAAGRYFVRVTAGDSHRLLRLSVVR